nr:MAG TPA: hypothetical protein [Caudoviricetes sp.]
MFLVQKLTAPHTKLCSQYLLFMQHYWQIDVSKFA